jgi:hypothetical protein
LLNESNVELIIGLSKIQIYEVDTCPCTLALDLVLRLCSHTPESLKLVTRVVTADDSLVHDDDHM